ncbi:glycosyltransferase [Demequina sp. NBRC 110053]|uniref:glycosyltransferase n=1 Tax=Demequina sp. NBRC 110053 TaxID=1570342 RepID=UPI0009FF3B90|nr:glycosyltransferase [Demequina sp. NBRC 110053]
MNVKPDRRLVIVVRADPVICGHSGEARNLAEAALARGFDDVRILSWPIELLERTGLPLKPVDSVLPYSPGITVERPEPVGGYKIPDGRYLSGLVGRLVELFTDGVPTVCMSLYLSPHTLAVADAVRVARSTGLPMDVTTIAEAVGSDVTAVVQECVEADRFGAAAHVLSAYLEQDVCVAVSQYTKDVIVEAAEQIDARHGTRFAPRCRDRIGISFPAIDTSAYLDLDPADTERFLAARGLTRDGYILYLSRLGFSKGVADLIDGFAASMAGHSTTLVIAGRGPDAEALRAHAASSDAADRIVFLDDVGDEEKPHLMAACAAYALPSKPGREFTETFGIALVEEMLAGGGPVITCPTGGIPEAVGDTALMVPVEDPAAIAGAIDTAVLGMSAAARAAHRARARVFAMQFDREPVFDRLFEKVAVVAHH